MNNAATLTQATRSVVEKLYAGAQQGDVAGLFALISADVVLREPPFLPYGGEYVGLDGFTKAIGFVMEQMDLTRLEVNHLVVDGERAFAVVRIPVRSGGTALLAEEWRVRDGKVTEVRIFFHDAGSIRLSAA